MDLYILLFYSREYTPRHSISEHWRSMRRRIYGKNIILSGIVTRRTTFLKLNRQCLYSQELVLARVYWNYLLVIRFNRLVVYLKVRR